MTILPLLSSAARRPTRRSIVRAARTLVLAGLTASLAAVSSGASAPAYADSGGFAPAFTIADRISAGQIKAHHVGYLMASCNRGEERIGGGFFNAASVYSSTLSQWPVPDRYPVLANRPEGTSSWTVGLLNRTDGDTPVIVHALCASGPIGTVVVKAVGPTYDPGSTSPGVQASCPAGTVVTAGGWDVGAVQRLTQVLSVSRSIPLHAARTDAWLVSAAIPNQSSAPISTQVSAYAVCVAGGTSRTSTGFLPFKIPGGPGRTATWAQPSATCPAGNAFTRGQLTGTGFELSQADGSLSLTSLAPSRVGVPTRWTATVASLPAAGIDSTGNIGGTGRLFPVCVHVPLVLASRVITQSPPIRLP